MQMQQAGDVLCTLVFRVKISKTADCLLRSPWVFQWIDSGVCKLSHFIKKKPSILWKGNSQCMWDKWNADPVFSDITPNTNSLESFSAKTEAVGKWWAENLICETSSMCTLSTWVEVRLFMENEGKKHVFFSHSKPNQEVDREVRCSGSGACVEEHSPFPNPLIESAAQVIEIKQREVLLQCPLAGRPHLEMSHPLLSGYSFSVNTGACISGGNLKATYLPSTPQ